MGAAAPPSRPAPQPACSALLKQLLREVLREDVQQMVREEVAATLQGEQQEQQQMAKGQAQQALAEALQPVVDGADGLLDDLAELHLARSCCSSNALSWPAVRDLLQVVGYPGSSGVGVAVVKGHQGYLALRSCVLNTPDVGDRLWSTGWLGGPDHAPPAHRPTLLHPCLNRAQLPAKVREALPAPIESVQSWEEEDGIWSKVSAARRHLLPAAHAAAALTGRSRQR